MRRINTNECDPDELLMVSHTEVAIEGCKPEEYKRDRDPVVIRVCNRGIGIVVRLPATLLKINSESVWRDLTENFISRKFSSDVNHDQREKLTVPIAAALTCPLSGSDAFLGADFVPLGR